MIKLNKSRVVFNEGDHTYHLGDKELKGVTGILERRLFPEKYSKIPKHILEQAAQRGSYIHKMCELVDTLGVTPTECQEAVNYIDLKKRLGLKSIASEYLVSDNEHYASSIDVIYEGQVGVILNDRKTTRMLDRESVSWQLSIYALFFEMLNPDVKVEGLSATWLRGDICEYIEVERKSNEMVEALLLADINDEPFEYEANEGVPDFINERLDTMAYLYTKIKVLQTEFDTIKKEIEDEMVKNDIKSVKTGVASFSYTLPKTSTEFDKELFLKEHPEYLESYQKEKLKKGFLTIKFK